MKKKKKQKNKCHTVSRLCIHWPQICSLQPLFLLHTSEQLSLSLSLSQTLHSASTANWSSHIQFTQFTRLNGRSLLAVIFAKRRCDKRAKCISVCINASTCMRACSYTHTLVSWLWSLIWEHDKHAADGAHRGKEWGRPGTLKASPWTHLPFWGSGLIWLSLVRPWPATFVRVCQWPPS